MIITKDFISGQMHFGKNATFCTTAIEKCVFHAVLQMPSCC